MEKTEAIASGEAFLVAAVVLFLGYSLCSPYRLELIYVAQDGLELLSILQPRPPAR